MAEQQYDYIGEGNANPSDTYDGWIDLFGWSSDSTKVPFGAGISTDSADYRGHFVDWGTNIIGTDTANTWRTLTLDEWLYLFQHTRWTIAKVNGTLGFMLLPDFFETPVGLSVSILGDGNLTDASKNYSESDYSTNIYN